MGLPKGLTQLKLSLAAPSSLSNSAAPVAVVGPQSRVRNARAANRKPSPCPLASSTRRYLAYRQHRQSDPCTSCQTTTSADVPVGNAGSSTLQYLGQQRKKASVLEFEVAHSASSLWYRGN